MSQMVKLSQGDLTLRGRVEMTEKRNCKLELLFSFKEQEGCGVYVQIKAGNGEKFVRFLIATYISKVYLRVNFYIVPFRDRGCRSNVLSHPVTVY